MQNGKHAHYKHEWWYHFSFSPVVFNWIVLFSEEMTGPFNLQDLVRSLLKVNPAERPTIEQVPTWERLLQSSEMLRFFFKIYLNSTNVSLENVEDGFKNFSVWIPAWFFFWKEISSMKWKIGAGKQLFIANTWSFCLAKVGVLLTGLYVVGWGNPKSASNTKPQWISLQCVGLDLENILERWLSRAGHDTLVTVWYHPESRMKDWYS